MNGKCVASSTGLEYELDNHQLEMGKLVSSSNSVETEMITVKTDIPIIWTIKFASQKL
jgi:thiamine pyrophosphokinase